jgi:hypothetical protein
MPVYSRINMTNNTRYVTVPEKYILCNSFHKSGKELRYISYIPPTIQLILMHVNTHYTVPVYTVRSESRCALLKGVGSDVHERLNRPELV